MARLPIVGKDDGAWGQLLNDFLSVEHNADGSLKSSGVLAAKADDTAVVHITGDETISGTKTFSLSPIIPTTPTDSNQATSKAYVDATVTANSAASIIPVAATLAGQPTPFAIAHRGNLLHVPEECMEGFRASVAMGCNTLEMDVQPLLDNSLSVMHDSTIDRTTTGTGDVAGHTASSWKQLSMDPSVWLGGGWADGQHPPLFDEVLREFGNKVLLVPEMKTTGRMPVLISTLQRYNIDARTVLVQAGSLSDALVAKNAGYNVIWLYTTDYATAAANGIKYIGPVYTALDQTLVQNSVAAGVDIIPFVVNRRVDMDRFVGWGCKAVFSDDSLYVGRSSTVACTKDPFTSGMWFPGIAGNTDRGKFYSGGSWGWDVNGSTVSFALHGWATPPNTSSFTVDLTVQIDALNGGDATRWLSIFVGKTDQAYGDLNVLDGPSGYHFLLRGNGELSIWRRSATSSGATNLATQSGSALTLGAGVPMRLTITPTSVTWRRTDGVGTTVTANDSTHRPLPSLHFGRSGVGCRFRGITIS